MQCWLSANGPAVRLAAIFSRNWNRNSPPLCTKWIRKRSPMRYVPGLVSRSSWKDWPENGEIYNYMIGQACCLISPPDILGGPALVRVPSGRMALAGRTDRTGRAIAGLPLERDAAGECAGWEQGKGAAGMERGAASECGHPKFWKLRKAHVPGVGFTSQPANRVTEYPNPFLKFVQCCD